MCIRDRSCSDVCPVKVDLAEQIYTWRQDLDGLGKANTGKKIMSGGMKFLMERPALFNAALWAAPVVNGLPRFMKYNDLDDWGKGRELPEFARDVYKRQDSSCLMHMQGVIKREHLPIQIIHIVEILASQS